MEESKTGDKMRAHQLVMLELLHQVDSICSRHNIPYMLFAGTLLGAVRHNGFIPWDDDLDLVLLRPDYERFLTAAEGELDPERFYLQREFSSHWPMQWSKIRRQDTTCLEKYYPKDPETHQGIFIDVFPCDALSDHNLVAKLQFLASKIVIAKALNARGYVTYSRAKKIVLFTSRFFPCEPLVRLVQLKGKQNTKCVHVFFGGAKRYSKSIFPRVWMEQQIRAKFEDASFLIPKEYDALLTTLYGDYHTLPSLEERRKKNHAFFVDPEHSYLLYSDAYDGVTFDVLTTSIR